MKQLNLYWLGGGGSSVPDGRTVTPINDVILLQQCAGISNPTYTKISEILTDTGILQTILSNQNAVNYLVRCKDFTTWKNYIPDMTSDTTPSGECFGSAYATEAYYYYAFDGETSGGWIAPSNATNNYIGYEYPSSVSVSKCDVWIRRYNGTPARTFKLQKYNGESWEDVESISVPAQSSGQTYDKFTVTFNETQIKKFRLFCSDSLYVTGSWIIGIQNVRMYSPGFCDFDDPMRYIGLNNYAANTLLDDSEWHEAICNSTYFERVLNVKAPKMTSATTPSGKVIFSGTAYSGQPYYSFNSDLGGWSANGVSCSYKLGYVFPEAIKIHKVVASVQSAGKLRAVEASNDETNWTEIANYNGQATGGTLNIFGASQYSGFRIFTENTSSSSYLTFNQWQFYGRKDV